MLGSPIKPKERAAKTRLVKRWSSPGSIISHVIEGDNRDSGVTAVGPCQASILVAGKHQMADFRFRVSRMYAKAPTLSGLSPDRASETSSPGRPGGNDLPP